METGTGKTYVYIKTMFELNKLYGWSKFIVVVPSIAIREGVQKSFETMREHFKAYYGKIIRPFVYNSKKLSDIDNYSQSADINVMIINIQATVTVATPGGGTGIQLQVNLSTNDDKSTPAVRLLAAAVRPLTWEKHEGRPLNRRLYLPEYCLSAHDPSFGREMDLPLVMAALMNRWGEDILPEEVAYAMEDNATRSTGNAAFAAAAAGCCGFPCWQAWMDLQDLRTQIHDDCPVAVRVERRIRGQRDPVGIWMGLRGFGHDDAVMADYVLLNDPTADSDGSVNCTMALSDFLRYFTGRAIALRRKPRDAAADLPNRVRCDLARSEDGRCYYFEQRGQRDPLPDDFSGWTAYTLHDGIAHATTAHRTFRRMERTPDGGLCFPPEQLAAGGRCSVYAVDQTGRMRVAEVRLSAPPRPPAAPPAAPQNDPQSTGQLDL